jgi:hypothetical protein
VAEDKSAGANLAAPGRTRVASRQKRAVSLSSGQALSLEVASRSAADQRANFIVLAGPVESGKTTLVLSVYEAFNVGALGDVGFAGSRTLIAFEERCHEGRMTSGLDVATTRRTPRTDGTEFLHLVVTPAGAGSARCHSYVSDITGEVFQELVRSPRIATDLPALSQANRIQIVLDGSVLTNVAERDRAVYEAETLARGIADYAQLRGDAVIDVLVSKLDRVHEAGPEAIAWANAASAGILGAMQSPRAGRAFLTCARSEHPGVASLTGMNDVVETWSEFRLEGATGEPSRVEIRPAQNAAAPAEVAAPGEHETSREDLPAVPLDDAS